MHLGRGVSWDEMGEGRGERTFDAVAGCHFRNLGLDLWRGWVYVYI